MQRAVLTARHRYDLDMASSSSTRTPWLRGSRWTIAIAWLIAFASVVRTAIWVDPDRRVWAMTVCMLAVMLIAGAAQVISGTTEGFITRTAVAVGGAFVIMAVGMAAMALVGGV